MYWPQDQWVALLTMIVVILVAVGLRGFLGRIAIFLGLIFGYVAVVGARPAVRQDHVALAGGDRGHDRTSGSTGRGVQAADWFGFPPQDRPSAPDGMDIRRLAPARLQVGVHPARAAGRDRADRREHRSRQGGRRDDRDRPRPGHGPGDRRRRRRHRRGQLASAARRPRRTRRTSASWRRPGSTRRPPTTSPRSSRSCSGSSPKFGALIVAPPRAACSAASRSCCTA